MGIASDMKDLTTDLAASRQDRAGAVNRIRQDAKQAAGDARKLIGGLAAGREQAGRELRKGLARDKAKRGTEVKGMLGDAQGLIKGFRASRRHEAASLRKELNRDTRERRAETRGLRGEARQTLHSFHSQREQMNASLREVLDRGRSAIRNEVGELIGGARAMLTDLAKSRRESGSRLKEERAGGRAERESQVKATQEQHRQSRVAIRGELEEARAAWQGLTGASHPRKAAAKSRLNTESTQAAAPEKELPDLEARVLDAIAAHPGGTTLTEIAESLGVVPIVLGRVSKRLVDSGKVRKEDKLYFPAAS